MPLLPLWPLVTSQACWKGRSAKHSPLETPGQGPVPVQGRLLNCMLSLVQAPMVMWPSTPRIIGSRPAPERSIRCWRIGSGTARMVWSAVTVLVPPPSRAKVRVCVPLELRVTAWRVRPCWTVPAGSAAAMACGSWSLPPVMW